MQDQMTEPVGREGLTPSSPKVISISARPQPATRPEAHSPLTVPPVLPAQPGPLIGRESDLGAIATMLRDPNTRLVTLSGTGGVGKTRLALAAGELAQADFADGVHWIDLSTLTDWSQVLPRIADQLGVDGTSGWTTEQSLRHHLCERQLLLIIDNCEQVRDAVCSLSGLLAACPGLKILATSRIPFLVRWEHEWSVQPLATTAHGQQLTADTLSLVPAAALFLDRLRAIRPQFVPDDADATVIAAICARLDGLPLALELAAALVRTLPLPALLARLTNCSPLDVLANGPRDLPERHRALRDTITWSHDLLDQESRHSFRRLGIFVGSWSAVEALTVCGEDRIGALLEASLICRAPDSAGEGRYSMLDTMRDYALDRLLEAREWELIAERHARCYLALAERAEAELTGPRQGAWLARLDLEQDNLVAALRWALNNGQPDVALGLMITLGRYWLRRSYRSDTRELLEAALRLSPAAEPRQCVRILQVASRWFLRWGDRDRAFRLAAEVARLDPTLDDPGSAASSAAIRGIAALARADSVEALHHFEESVHAYLLAGDRAQAARHHLAAGSAAWYGGDTEATRWHWQRALDLGRESDDEYAISGARSNLGLIALAEGDYERAGELAQATRVRFEAGGDVTGTSQSRHILGLIAAHNGHYHQAEPLFQENLRALSSIGNKSGIAIGLQDLAALATWRGQHERAARLFAAAEVSWQRLGLHPAPQSWSPYGECLRDLREQLSAASFDRAWVAGRELTEDEAITMALAAVPSPSAIPSGPPPTETTTAINRAHSPHKLTERQGTVAELVALGLTNREIAERLSISERTADAHLQAILERLDFTSRSQIASWVTERSR